MKGEKRGENKRKKGTHVAREQVLPYQRGGAGPKMDREAWRVARKRDGWREGVAMWARSLLFLSSWVLFSSCAEPHTEPARAVSPSPAGLPVQPGTPTQARWGTPISTSQPIKVSFATHM